MSAERVAVLTFTYTLRADYDCPMARRSSAIRSHASRRAAGLGALAAVLLLVTHGAQAHLGISEAEDAVAHAIEESPRDPKLYLHRATLERKRGDWDAAAASYTKAAELGADPDFTDVALAVVLSEAGLQKTALARVNLALQRKPDSAVAVFTRARIHRAVPDPRAAAADYARAIELLQHPEPGAVLEAMDAQLAVPIEDAVVSDAPVAADDGTETGLTAPREATERRLRAALSIADTAIAKLGVIPTIQSRAIELEVELGRYDAAVARIDRMLEKTPHHEFWVAQRGDLLAAAGNDEEARQAYRRALALIEARPIARRSSKIESLEEELHDKLAANTEP